MLLDAFDAYLLDLDGVVYVGGQALPGAPGTVAELRGRGRIVRFLTNDPRPTRAELAARLTALGIPAQPKDVITAGWATAAWLGRQGLRSAFALGGPGLASELTAAGITLVDRTPSADPPHEISDFAGTPDPPHEISDFAGTPDPPHEISDFAGTPDAVVAGCDERVDYAALHEAARHVLAGARFVATNPDPWFPGEDGRRPATGAIVAALREVTGVSPAVVGKPELPMFEAALRELPAGARTVVVGDSPDTDVAGAHRAGLPAVLVGPSAPAVVAGDPRRPDAVIPALRAVLEAPVELEARPEPRFPWPRSIAPGVAAVVFDGRGRVLLGRRTDRGQWGLPSGHVEAGEAVVDAVCREVREETGLEVTVERLIGVYSDPTWQVFGYPSGALVHFVTTCFACRVAGGRLQADGVETAEVAFFETDRLPDDLLRMHPAWLPDALAGSTAPFLR